MPIVSCAKWIRKGVAKSIPDKVQLTSQELKAIWSSRKEEVKLATECIEETPGNLEGSNDKYNFEGYDNDSENIQSTLGIETLISLDSSQQIDKLEEDIDSEAEDEVIHTDDNLIVVGHVEEDASVLEVYVYNEKNGDLYVHHDILLPTFPLCLEWLNFEPSQPSPGNLVAVGGMCPEVMVWDLDIVNCLEPAFKLGRYSKKNSKKLGKENIGHQDAVLDISWNENVSHILASASVDESVIVWDIEHGKIGLHLTDFTDNVQCIKWHPSETQILLSGCCDQYVRVFDCRLDPAITKWQVNGKVEHVCWNPVSAQSWEALIGTNNGMINCIDTRTNKCKWQLTAHEKEITGLLVHHMCPEIMTTCAADGLLKLWDITKNSPLLLSTKSINSGELHCLDLNPDIPYLACTGGSKKSNIFVVSDLRKQISDHQRFYWGQEENHLPSSSLEDTSSSHIESAAAKSLSTNKNRRLKKKKKINFKKKQAFNDQL